MLPIDTLRLRERSIAIGDPIECKVMVFNQPFDCAKENTATVLWLSATVTFVGDYQIVAQDANNVKRPYPRDSESWRKAA